MSRSVLAVVTDPAAHEPAHRALVSLLPVVAVLDAGVFAADLRGTERLLGSPARIARKVLARIRDPQPSVAIAGGTFVARTLAAETARGSVRLLAPHEERFFLDSLSLEALPLDEEVRDELRLLGLRRVGDFARLPRGSVFDRFGRAAAYAHALACGEEPEPLVGSRPRDRLVAARHWDDAIDGSEPLLFALRSLVDELAARLGTDGQAVLRLGVRLEREDELPLHLERVVLPPSGEGSALLRSVRWALEERRDLGRIIGVQLEALSVEDARGRQVGLFAPDGARREEAQSVAAYLRSRLGPGRVVRARIVAEDARLPERVALFDEVAS
jgi:nucleotidyltransferase/DNA polymerase involved in DNA repair